MRDVLIGKFEIILEKCWFNFGVYNDREVINIIKIIVNFNIWFFEKLVRSLKKYRNR